MPNVVSIPRSPIKCKNDFVNWGGWVVYMLLRKVIDCDVRSSKWSKC